MSELKRWTMPRHWLAAAALCLVAISWTAFAQEDEEEGAEKPAPSSVQHVLQQNGPAPTETAPPPPDAESAPAEAATEPVKDKKEEVDAEEGFAERLRLIQGQEKPEISTRGYSYDPGNRRDPFVSPAEVAAGKVPDDEGGKAPKIGINRMRIQEIIVMGVITFPDGTPRAIVMGNDSRGYWLKAGDQLGDGILMSVDVKSGEVIFRQDVADPLQIKPYREVVRQLFPVEEERRKK